MIYRSAYWLKQDQVAFQDPHTEKTNGLPGKGIKIIKLLKINSKDI